MSTPIATPSSAAPSPAATPAAAGGGAPSSTVPASTPASTPAPAPAVTPAVAPSVPSLPGGAPSPAPAPAVPAKGAGAAEGTGGKEASVFGTPSPIDGVVESLETLTQEDPHAKEMGYGGLEKESAAQRRAKKAAAAKAAKAGLPTPPVVGQPPAPATVPAAALPQATEGAFTFAGKQYKSQADAENRLSTLEGKLRQSTEHITGADGLTRAWITHSEKQDAIIRQLSARLEGGPPAEGAAIPGAPATPQSGTSPKAAAAPTPESTSAEFIKGFDWETFNGFYTDEKRGPGPALAYLADQMTQHMAKSQATAIDQIRGELRPELDALAQDRQQRTAETQITQIWSEAIQARDPQTGAVVMPELAADPAALQEVKNIWLTHFPPAHIQNKDQANATMWASYLIWTSQRSRQGTVAQVAATGAGSAAEAVLNAASQAAGAQATVVGGAPVSSLSQPPSAGSPGKPLTEEEEIKQSFREGGNLSLQDPDGNPLGFPV